MTLCRLGSFGLVFDLHHYKPTPLYVMCDNDAALGQLQFRSLHLLAISKLLHESTDAFISG